MDKIKQFFGQKKYGFYVTLALIVISLVTGILYNAFYHSYAAYMSQGAFILPLIAAIGGLALLFVMKGKFAPGFIVLMDFIALLLFIEQLYGYVVVVLVGIDVTSFSPQFITCCVLYGLLLVAGIANVFMPQHKEVK